MSISSLFVVILAMPLIVYIIIPLLMLSCWLATRPIKFLVPSRFGSEIAIRTSRHHTKAESDKRVESRIATQGLTAKIADGHGVYDSLVANISRAGVCLKNVPERLSASTERLSVIIRGKTEEYSLLLAPSWDSSHHSRGRVIGGKIDTPPNNWLQFVHSQ